MLGITTRSNAQIPKKPLDHTVYDKWQSINSEAISNDGKFVVYSIIPQEGDANLVFQNLHNGKSLEIPRGVEPIITEDSKYTIFLIRPYYAAIRAAKIKKTKSIDMPKDSLGIIDNVTLGIRKIANVQSYQISKSVSPVIAISVVPSKTEKTTVKIIEKQPQNNNKSDKITGNLILFNLITNTQKQFEKVSEYALSTDGEVLGFVHYPAKKDSLKKVSVYYFNTKTALNKIISTGGEYSNLTFSKNNKLFAFTKQLSSKNKAVKINTLLLYHSDLDSAQTIVNKHTDGLKKNWEVSTNGKLSFSEDGKRLYFGTAPIVSPKDTSIVDFEVADLDIWNYKDNYLQPYQLRNKEKELKRSYAAVIDLSDKGKIIQLADEECPTVNLGHRGNAKYGLALTNFGHQIETQWLGSDKKALYLISIIDGKRTKIAETAIDEAYLSPKANYVIWFDAIDSNWNCYDIKKQSTRILNKGIEVSFSDELNDMPRYAAPYGLSGFSEDDQSVLIYDRYDIWKFALDKSQAINLTKGLGRKEKITFRYYSLSQSRESRKRNELTIVKYGEPMFIDAFNEQTKANGWYKTSLSGTNIPQRLVMEGVSYSRPFLNKASHRMIYTKENYKASPDLYVSKEFKEEKKISNINPWQKDYNWGTAELFKWTTPKGHSSEGILYKPENFDTNKSYPMIVYFYEKLTNGLNKYIAPAPTPSRINISYFVSNGYIVFAPDIAYEAGHPGRSAEEYINSGVEALKKNKWINSAKIGIQGQSWGGYQVAHLITRTNIYAAAWAGAPVVDMFSAYGGIRWESGMSRQFQYEKTQSRIGATIWEKPELYIENSPLFHLPNVNTPVVIMANDADGAVPWYQGIEMFTALRRLGKPVWMLNYNNDAHNLMKRQNRKDIQRREQQFFDHYLKGAPAPVWMEKGVPAVEKGINWGFDLMSEEK